MARFCKIQQGFLLWRDFGGHFFESRSILSHLGRRVTGEVDLGSLQDELWDITMCFLGLEKLIFGAKQDELWDIRM